MSYFPYKHVQHEVRKGKAFREESHKVLGGYNPKLAAYRDASACIRARWEVAPRAYGTSAR